MMKKPVRIIHIITALPSGGAEMMLYKLLEQTDRTRYDPLVVTMLDRGFLGPRIEQLGIPVRELHMRPGRPTLAAMFRLWSVVRQFRPHLIQGWMYHANLLAIIARLVAPENPPVLWNIRHSVSDISNEKRLTRAIIKIGAWLSEVPVGTIYNSRVAVPQHVRIGYKEGNSKILPNGFNTNRFCPSETTRQDFRNTLGIPNDNPLIGMIARYHPMKDHATFVRACARVAQVIPEARFIMVGENVTEENSKLQEDIKASGFSGRFHLLGERSDIETIIPSLDVLATASAWGEGFPNVIGEAMSCAVPCVVTDIGDSAWILGVEKGLPPHDSEALATGILSILAMSPSERRTLGNTLRERVLSHFSIEQVVTEYQDYYDHILSC